MKLKTLILFHIAAASLLLAGHLLHPVWNAGEMLLLQWCGFCGIIFVYSLHNRLTDLKHWLSFFRDFSAHPLKVIFVLQFVFLTLPVSVFFLSGFRLLVLGGICLMGIFYSVNIAMGNKNYIIKKLFLVKNVFIGFGWGALILVGAGTFEPDNIKALFLFTSFQVLLGSIIRDISDLERDSGDGFRTVPLVIGVDKTLLLLHIANLLSFLPPFFFFADKAFGIFMLIIIGWKSLSLLKVKSNHGSPMWTQTFNILTCFFIFIIILIQRAYELY
jgi:4-hydroxybenzoate polyprenyltransferase